MAIKPPDISDTSTKPDFIGRISAALGRNGKPLGRRWTLFWVWTAGIVLAICVVYGLWRAAGGSFKPKSPCDTGQRTTLQQQAGTNAEANLKYADYVYTQCQDFPGAITAYQDVLQKGATPNYATTAQLNNARRGLGLAYLYNRDYKSAQATFKATTEAEPTNAFNFYLYGSALKPDNINAAIAAWQKAVALDPTGTVGQNAQKAIDEAKK